MLALATLGAAAASSYAEESAACAAAGGAARVAEADLPDDGTCFQWDGVELANRSYCQPCLNGSYWDEFRDARAASRRAAATAAPVVVEMPYWLSGQLQASAMRILLEEVLGYAVHISLASAGSGSTARVAADCATLVPEFWCCPCFCCGRRCPTSAAGAATRRRRRRSSCFFSRSPWCP